MKINKCKKGCAKINVKKFSIGGLIGVQVSSTVNEVIRTILRLLFFFYGNILNAQKRKSSQKIPNKKTSAQKTIKATIFCVQKLLAGGKLFILRFFLNIEVVLVASFTLLLSNFRFGKM